MSNHHENGHFHRLYSGMRISVAIFWLTVVETTSSIRLMKSTAYSFIAAIVIQIILQFAFIANFHGKFKVSKIKYSGRPKSDTFCVPLNS